MSSFSSRGVTFLGNGRAVVVATFSGHMADQLFAAHLTPNIVRAVWKAEKALELVATGAVDGKEKTEDSAIIYYSLIDSLGRNHKMQATVANFSSALAAAFVELGLFNTANGALDKVKVMLVSVLIASEKEEAA